MEDIIIVGFGGHAKSIADSIERMGKYHILGYTDTEERTSKYNYLGTDDSLEELFRIGVRYAAVGVGYLGKADGLYRIVGFDAIEDKNGKLGINKGWLMYDPIMY